MRSATMWIPKMSLRITNRFKVKRSDLIECMEWSRTQFGPTRVFSSELFQTIYFCKPTDAMLFKLQWHGSIIESDEL